MGAIISNFFAALVQWITYACQYFAGVIAGCFDALVYYANLIFTKITNPIFDLLVSLLDGSGMAGYIATLNQAITGGLGFFLDFFHAPQAMTAIVSAYMLRFIIRRIPVIG